MWNKISKYWAILFMVCLSLTCEKQVFDNPYDPAYTITPPSEVSATPISETSILLSWKNNDAAKVEFQIERKTTNEFELVGESVVNDSTFIDTGLAYGTNYLYRVTAFAGGNKSVFSDEVSKILVIPTPTNVTATYLTNQQIQVEWIDNCVFETSFKIERSINDSNFEQFVQLPANTTSYVDTVSPLGWHHYRVTATTELHESDYSNVASGWSGITFSRTFNYSAKGNSVSQTTDEGYIIAGNSGLLKTDKVGNEEWYREYGSGGVGYSVAETKDGGYITTGGNDYNVFLIKTDADGNLLWNKSLTGEVGFSVQQTIDDGYIVCGKIYTDAIWWYDMILIKTDSYGNEIWSQTFGSGLVDEAYCVEQTLDGGYIITGEKDAGDYQNTNTKMWLIKTDPDGNIEWDYEHSGGSHHHGQSVQQTRDGGFIVAGQSGSNMSLFKIISNGSLDWTNTYSGTYSSLGYDVRQTTDEGYIVTGRINSAEEGPSNVDVYIIKTDDSGSLHWERVFGNGSYDAGYSAEQTSDSGYIVVGENNGQIWLIKTDPEGNVY